MKPKITALSGARWQAESMTIIVPNVFLGAIVTWAQIDMILLCYYYATCRDPESYAPNAGFFLDVFPASRDPKGAEFSP